MRGTLRLLTMKSVTFIVLILLSTASLFSCYLVLKSPPTLRDVTADHVVIGFKDGTTVQLDRENPEFKRISDEVVRLFQGCWIAQTHVEPLERMEEWKQRVAFVEIGFDSKVQIPFSRLVEEKDRDEKPATEDGWEIMEPMGILTIFSNMGKDYRQDQNFTVYVRSWGHAESWSVLESHRNNHDIQKLVKELYPGKEIE